MFIHNLWYVAAWASEVGDAPVARTIIGVPLVLWRPAGGAVVAMQDRCPHRLAPLSAGRIEQDAIRCMYHGLTFAADGACRAVPGSSVIPPNCAVRCFPAAERDGWIWCWMGAPEAADPAQIPALSPLACDDWFSQASALDYAADYELINDNLTDLSHLDFVHDTTLRAASGSYWATEHPTVTPLDDGLLIQRWFADAPLSPASDTRCDIFNSYRYLLPGIFLMSVRFFPAGTASASEFGEPAAASLIDRIDQQAVTPMGPGRTRYQYATWMRRSQTPPEMLDAIMGVVNAAFAEDKRMIEAQQRVWAMTPPEHPRAFIPQDKAPAMFRRLIARRLAAEAAT